MIGIRTVATTAFATAALILSACQQAPPPAPLPAPPPAPPALAGPTSISERTLLTMAADIAFPSGGYRLNRTGKEELNEIVPAIKNLHDAKVVVYGYTDNRPVGPALRKRGIADNLDLSSKRAGEVVRYLRSQGIEPSIMSAKGRGDTHPIASNDTAQGRAQNRRIEVVVEQPTG
jgi:chemotaxis protein MotB